MSTREIWTGDNLEVLSQADSGSVQLVYMDPPFASGRNYEAIFSTSRQAGSERVWAFGDKWGQSGATNDVNPDVFPALAQFLQFVRSHTSAAMANYLEMMTPRLLESHRTLGPEGSLYLHCDSSASHYLKLLLDAIFGAENFRNEIIWKRTHAHSSSKRFGPVHDVILFYSKSNDFIWNPSFSAYDPAYLAKHYRQSDEVGNYQLITCTGPGDRTGTRAHYEWHGVYPPPGRHWAWKIEKMQELEAAGLLIHSATGVPRFKRYAQDGRGVALQDVWLDINRLDAKSAERVGYETQKPTALLERIISASTRPGDLVIDPFCGSGTTAVAAERLGRSWKVADMSLLATSYALSRTRQLVGRHPISLHGFPTSVRSAEKLRAEDPQTFGIWGTSMLVTVADRNAFTQSIASGAGQARSGPKNIELLSWVPLGERAPVAGLKRAGSKRLPELGLVLDGAGASNIEKWVSRELPALPVQRVGLKRLVGTKSLQTGMTDDFPTWFAGTN